MSDRSNWYQWWLIVGGLAVLFVVRYAETSDWKVGAVTVLSIVTLISSIAAVASVLLLLIAKRSMTRFTYAAIGIASLGLMLLPLLGVSLERLGIFAAVAVFAGVFFVVIDWLKGRFF